MHFDRFLAAALYSLAICSRHSLSPEHNIGRMFLLSYAQGDMVAASWYNHNH